eukprot:m.708295 g.708295  ORF g.708295 m.708295 type:complete len:135 (+) comp22937_c3_seq5:148-552(+)
MAAKALDHVKRVAVRFYSYDDNSRFCREFIRRVTPAQGTPAGAGPKIDCNVSSTPVAPEVTITYVDDTTVSFTTAPPLAPRTCAARILKEVAMKRTALEFEEWAPWNGVVWDKWKPEPGLPDFIQEVVDRGIKE